MAAADPVSRRIPLPTGLTYHALEWDAPSEHTVILLHGFLDHSWGWQPVADAGLGGRFHLVAPDMRGHGDSDRVGAGGYYYFADYLADLHELIDLVGRERVSLVGHSMGGNIAVYYSGTFPKRVHKLALLEALVPPHVTETNPERIASWIDAWRRTRARPQHSYATVDEAAARLVERDARLDPALALRLAAHGTIAGADGRLRFKHDPLHLTPGPYGIRADVARTFWARVACPTLIMEAAESEYGFGDSSARRPTVEGARREVVAAAGHMLLRHQPARVAELLADFLAP
ncbi:MAG TPA: alpha/beta hydrolase [Polyangia bacterium]|nr:alpha/beta hydrolase [Polyangia bacterium]